MIIYLVVFALSSGLFALSEHTASRRKRRMYLFLAVMIPAVLAGCRAASVGTDVRLYEIGRFRRALAAESFNQYFATYHRITHSNALLSEPLYFILVYALSRVFSNYHWLLFADSLLTVSFAYAGMERYKKQMNAPVWLGMLLYYLALYNTSLNATRQLIAVSIVFFASSFLFEAQYAKFLIWIGIGVGFHSSAALGLTFLPVYLIFRQKQTVDIKQQVIKGTLFSAAVCMAPILGAICIRWLVASGIIRANYLNYLPGGLYAGQQISIAALLVYGGYLLLYLLHYKYLAHHRMESLFFAIISCIVLLSRFGQLISVYLPRAGYYFIPLQVVSLSNITNCYSTKSKKFWILLVVGYSAFAWFGMFVYRGSSDTVPYIFDLQT